MTDMQNGLQDWIAQNRISAPARALAAPAAARAPQAPTPSETENNENEVKTPGGFSAYPLQPNEHAIRIEPQRLQLESDESEAARVARGAARIREALEGVVAGSPEDLAASKRTIERLNEELKAAYREIGALRRITAATARHPGAKYYESMGQALEADADDLLDILDGGDELPAELAAHLAKMAKNLSRFAMNSVAYAQTLN